MSNKRLRIGVLSIQGDIAENIASLRAALVAKGLGDSNVVVVRTSDSIRDLDGLVIPGGESTTIGKLSYTRDIMDAIKHKVKNDGMPILGICAGMIMLSRSADDHVVGKTNQPLIGLIDIQIERNSFGSQRNSFESVITMDSIGIPQFNGVFIRAPSVSTVGSDTQVISTLDKKIIAIKKGNILCTSFHPELTHDLSLHLHFVDMVSTASKDMINK